MNGSGHQKSDECLLNGRAAQCKIRCNNFGVHQGGGDMDTQNLITEILSFVVPFRKLALNLILLNLIYWDNLKLFDIIWYYLVLFDKLINCIWQIFIHFLRAIPFHHFPYHFTLTYFRGGWFYLKSEFVIYSFRMVKPLFENSFIFQKEYEWNKRRLIILSAIFNLLAIFHNFIS